ncbi:MAG: hypothetical protein C1942_08645 [Prosthecochloris sp.]|uniref:DUF2971 domain-containing protein n=1 Tax=Prosthecochloris sp. TaxID=290513 RepID=UPI0013C81FDD|nr:DUF2971 domain-containing protein [Prosthecochloris sp.]NEX12734.1 hypothetical protein [Prosthecochloris sp.]
MLYKYRGIEKFQYFVDIVLNQRLHAAPYFDLNDPMEGQYLYSSGELDSDVRRLIKGQKEKIKICSLSAAPDNELMWAHYAEGHRGVAIGVEVSEERHRLIPVQYDGPVQIGLVNVNNSTAEEILSHKLQVWKYEKEVRVFTRGKQYVPVTVREVLLGRSMSTQNIGFIKKLVASINSEIEVKSAPNA